MRLDDEKYGDNKNPDSGDATEYLQEVEHLHLPDHHSHIVEKFGLEIWD